MIGSRRRIRLILAIGTIVGVINAVGLAVSQPAQIGIATDVYHHAGAAVLSGGNPYTGTPPDHPGFHYLYPPILLVAMLPYGLADPGIAYALQTVLNLLTAASLAGLVVWTVEASGVTLERVDRALLAGYTVGWFPTASTVVMGQVNLQMALGIAVGTLLLERTVDPFTTEVAWTRRIRELLAGGRRLGNRSSRVASGTVFALVSLVKLFPALVGVWLLRLRAWRTLIGAIATGITGLIAGTVLFGPELTLHFFTETLARELAVATFADGQAPESPYMTIRRQFSVLLPGLPRDWLLPVALVVLAPVVVASYRRIDTRVNRLLALHATLLATLISFPLEPFYLGLTVFPMVPLVYLLDSGPGRSLYLVGVLIVSVPIWLGDLQVFLELGPAGLSDPLVAIARGFYTVAMPMMVGVWALLAGIVLRQRRSTETTGAD